MKAVILGKAGSVRVKEKNYRPFFGEKSLMDILIEKLIKILPREDIYLSCEVEKYRYVAKKYKINYILRDKEFTAITTSNVDVVRNVCKDIPGNSDILWVSCVEPFFDDFDGVLSTWNDLDKNKYDSLNVVYPQVRFLLNQNHDPIGWGFGHWHKYSQELPPVYQISWATAILSRKCIENISYIIGARPYWYENYSPVVDIDTEDDWDLAVSMYKQKAKKHISEEVEDA